MRVQFTKNRKLIRRAEKIAALNEQASPEARRARKAMNDTVIRRGKTNVNGFFGVERLKCKTKKKDRRVKLSPQLKLAIAGKL
jgi:heme-degrading monooxygenase HmoA